MRLRFRFAPTMSREPAHASHAPGLGHSPYINGKKNDWFQASLTSHFFFRYARLIVSRTFQPLLLPQQKLQLQQ